MLLRRVYACPSVSVPSILCSISPGLGSKYLPDLQSPVARLEKPLRVPRSQLCVSRRTASLRFTTSAVATAMTDHSLLTVHRIPCLSDNYVWVLQEPSGKVAIVDPSEAEPVAARLKELGLTPSYILNTHHHWDHTGGNTDLKKQLGLTIVGPKADAERIPGIDIALGEGDTWQFGDLEMRVMDTPGHTRGHITLWFPQAGAVFPGDTLFSMGCGRLFEGSPPQMWSSLSKIAALPPDTKVYCAHEYTAANAKFAVHVNPNNAALRERQEEVKALRDRGEATIPSTLQLELDTNPFLRPQDSDIRATLRIPADAADVDAFAAIRKAKDNF